MSQLKPSQLIQHDNLDDRREIVYLISRLSPARKLAFLSWACSQAAFHNSPQRPRPTASTTRLAELARWDDSAAERLTVEVVMDLWHLSLQYHFDLEKALAKLVEMVRLQPR